MNVRHFTKLALFAAVVAMAMCSCHEEKKTESPKVVPATDLKDFKICYVDEDSILANYNLAKDLDEAMLRQKTQYDAAEKQRASEINKFGNAMQQKYKNNEYLSEEAFNADQSKLQKMQADAENYLANMQQSIINEQNQSRTQLLDSIDNFMKEYAKKNGYSMVLLKSATLYIDDQYDVTKDVIDCLNKRYNKVGGSK